MCRPRSHPSAGGHSPADPGACPTSRQCEKLVLTGFRIRTPRLKVMPFGAGIAPGSEIRRESPAHRRTGSGRAEVGHRPWSLT
jgi:hypothetical protein